MKKIFLIMTLLFAIGTGVADAQKEKKFSVYGIGFYNQENLFDTTHDKGKNDFQYLPDGQYKWNDNKYQHKLHNMARVLADMGTDIRPDFGCAVIGLSEVENAHVLEDLVSQKPLKEKGFRYVHVEGPDRRGIDCALIYNPSLYTVKNVKLVPYVQSLEKDSAFYTRGFLTVSGELAGEHVTVIVCHLPSRFSGSFYREQGARQVKAVKDSILNEDPSCKVFVMGDMNDDPYDKSMAEALGGRRDINKVKQGEMFNPWWNILKKSGKGTLMYRGAWNLFDQIIITPNLLNQKGEKDYSSLKYWKSEVFRRDYLFQNEGKYKGSPKRTHAGGVWLNGYSDHLPVVMYLVKEQK